MRISELSEMAEVPLPTVKYYLREGLLPPGEPTARNQARYGTEHLARLRLIRILADVGGLRIDDIRALLTALDDPGRPLSETLDAAHRTMLRHPQPTHENPERARAEDIAIELAERRGWATERDAPAIRRATDAIAALLAMDFPDPRTLIDAYAEVADAIAEQEIIAAFSITDPADAPRTLAVGAVLGEALLNALRLMARQSAAELRLKPRRGSPG